MTAKKMRKAKTRKPARKIAAPVAEPVPAADETQILASNLSLHDLFQQQTATMLDRADLTDEQRQSILIGMNCPCCGAGGFSFTAKLRR